MRVHIMRIFSTPFSILLLVLHFCLLPSVLFAQKHTSEKLDSFSEAGEDPMLRTKIVCKFRPAYRAYLQGNQVALPELTSDLKALGPISFSQRFPTVAAPSSETDEFGRKMSDLSLIYTVELDTAMTNVQTLVRWLSGREEIEYAEPWYLAKVLYQPNDPLADTTGGVDNMWHLNNIRARQAWDIQQDGGDVVVGIVDSGTRSGHPDLQDNRALNIDDPIDGIDNDGDGYLDNYFGWDFGGDLLEGPGDNDPGVGNVHGLWVTGIVGATTDNGIGIPSLCLDCQYIPVKAAPNDNIGFISNGYDGIVYVVDQGADVVNCSWGSSSRTRLGEDVVQYAVVNQGAALVVAAGNSTSDRKFYPAAYDLALSIGNSTEADTLCCNSTYNYSLDLIAPGAGVMSTFDSTGYWKWSGTSASAPVAAGAVALTLAHFPQYSGFQAAQRVRITTDDVYDLNEPIHQDKMGSGRVNMYKALTAPMMPSIRTTDFFIENLSGGDFLRPGDTMMIQVDFVNYLEDAVDLDIQMEAPGFFSNYLEMIEDHFHPGEVLAGESFESGSSFVVRLSENSPDNFLVALKLVYADTATTYEDFEVLEFRVNKSYLDITENQFHTTINSQGNFGFNDYLFLEQGLGVQYQQSLNSLFEGGFLIGNQQYVYDRIRNQNPGSRDNDFRLEEAVQQIPNSDLADFEAKTVFSDETVFQNLGLNITQYAFAYQQEVWEDFIIFQYVIENTSGNSLTDLYAGLFADWDIYPFLGLGTTSNAASYDIPHRLSYAYDVSGNISLYYGLSLLTNQGMNTVSAFNDGTISFDTPGKFQALSTPPNPLTGSVGNSSSGGDVLQFLSGGPFSIPANQVDTIAFALIGGQNLADLQSNQVAALEAYRCQILGLAPDLLFTVSSDTIAVGESLQLVDVNPNATAWTWDFGDGNIASDATSSHTYQAAGTYTITLTVENESCQTTHTRTVRVEWPVGIEALESSNHLSVRPNPSSEGMQIIIKHPDIGPLQLSIVNLLGAEVWYTTAQKRDQELHLEVDPGPLPKGVYLLKISSQSWYVVQKIQRE